jgi:hypothetical protein
METTTIVVLIFAVVIIAALLLSRQVGVRFKGPLSTRFHMDASKHSSSPAPAVDLEDVTSRRGGLTAQDTTGRGSRVKKARVEKDIIASSTLPQRDTDPKGQPPA